MSENTDPKAPRPPRADDKPPRQVTVQPQEPAPWTGGPPKQPEHPERGPRLVPGRKQDKRSNRDRDGLE
jgi:hypothetical protein